MNIKGLVGHKRGGIASTHFRLLYVKITVSISIKKLLLTGGIVTAHSDTQKL